MKWKDHGNFLHDFVVRYADGEKDRWEFDLDYSGYMIEHFGPFEAETPKPAVKFARTARDLFVRQGDLSQEYFVYCKNDQRGMAEKYPSFGRVVHFLNKA